MRVRHKKRRTLADALDFQRMAQALCVDFASGKIYRRPYPGYQIGADLAADALLVPVLVNIGGAVMSPVGRQDGLSFMFDGCRVSVARFVYALGQGPIPEGFDVAHLDLDTKNNALENLALAESRYARGVAIGDNAPRPARPAVKRAAPGVRLPREVGPTCYAWNGPPSWPYALLQRVVVEGCCAA